MPRMTSTERYVAWNPTFQLGQGFHYASLSRRPSSVFTDQDFVVLDGSEAHIFVSLVTSTKDLVDTVATHLGGSGADQTKGIAAAAAFDYGHSLKISQYAVNLAVIVRVQTGAKSLKTNRRVRSEAWKKKRSEFLEMYGDHYIESCTQGGLLIALLEIHTETEEEQRSVSLRFDFGSSNQKPKTDAKTDGKTDAKADAKPSARRDPTLRQPAEEADDDGDGDVRVIKRPTRGGETGVKKPDAKKPDTKKPDGKKPDTKKPDTKKPDTKKPDTQPGSGAKPGDGDGGGSGLGLNYSADASFKLTTARNLENRSMTLKVHQLGGESYTCLTVDDLLKAASAFPGKVAGAPGGLLATLMPYSALGLGQAPSADLETAMRLSAELDQVQLRLVAAEIDLTYVASNPSLFPEKAVQEAKTDKTKVVAALRKVKEARQKLEDGEPAELPDFPAIALPERFWLRRSDLMPPSAGDLNQEGAASKIRDAWLAVQTLDPAKRRELEGPVSRAAASVRQLFVDTQAKLEVDLPSILTGPGSAQDMADGLDDLCEGVSRSRSLLQSALAELGATIPRVLAEDPDASPSTRSRIGDLVESVLGGADGDDGASWLLQPLCDVLQKMAATLRRLPSDRQASGLIERTLPLASWDEVAAGYRKAAGQIAGAMPLPRLRSA